MGTIAVQITVVVPIMAPVLLACYVLYFWLVHVVNRTNRELRRLANSQMGPMLTILNESGNGRLLLRTMDAESAFRRRYCKQLDEYNRFSYSSASVVTSGQAWIYIISFIISCAAGALILVSRDSYKPSMMALALTYTFLLPYFLNIFAMIFQFLLNS